MTLTGNKNFSVALSAFLKSLRVCLFYFIFFLIMSVLLTRMPKATSAELTKNEENILLLKQNKSIRCKIDKPWEQASEKKKKTDFWD